jgi:hypothetical protein
MGKRLLTQAEVQARRRRMADAYRHGRLIREIAEDFGVAPYAVAVALDRCLTSAEREAIHAQNRSRLHSRSVLLSEERWRANVEREYQAVAEAKGPAVTDCWWCAWRWSEVGPPPPSCPKCGAWWPWDTYRLQSKPPDVAPAQPGRAAEAKHVDEGAGGLPDPTDRQLIRELLES